MFPFEELYKNGPVLVYKNRNCLQIVPVCEVHTAHAVVGGDTVATLLHRGLSPLYQLTRNRRPEKLGEFLCVSNEGVF